MEEVLSKLWANPLIGLSCSLLCFELAKWCYQASGFKTYLQPTMLGAIFVALLIYTFGLDFSTYLKANAFIIFLLGPATVALAIPMYRQLPLLKQLLVPLLLTSFCGAVMAALSVVVTALVMGASFEVIWALISKSVTTPVAIEISREINAEVNLTTGAVVLTAIAGIVIAPPLFRLFAVNDARIIGFALGITAHGVGMSRAFEHSQKAGAFASLALCLTASFSAVFIPLAYKLFAVL